MRRPRPRKPPPRLAVVAGVALLLVSCTPAAVEDAPTRSVGAVFGDADATAATTTNGVASPPAIVRPAAAPRPVALAIPGIGVEVALVAVGLNDDGSMETPDFGFAGWYDKGPRPGAAGPAVIVAHYDSTAGPDVFYDLGALGAGERILVHRDDGSTATFVVEDVAQHPKSALPGERIWARSDRPRLTLITCGGVFDRTTGHYRDNLIVYAAAE